MDKVVINLYKKVYTLMKHLESLLKLDGLHQNNLKKQLVMTTNHRHSACGFILNRWVAHEK